MFGYDLVEVLVVACLLVVHVFHQWSEVRVSFCEDGDLSGVDENGSEFAGLVDAQGGGEELLLFGGEGPNRFAIGILLEWL